MTFETQKANLRNPISTHVCTRLLPPSQALTLMHTPTHVYISSYTNHTQFTPLMSLTLLRHSSHPVHLMCMVPLAHLHPCPG